MEEFLNQKGSVINWERKHFEVVRFCIDRWRYCIICIIFSKKQTEEKNGHDAVCTRVLDVKDFIRPGPNFQQQSEESWKPSRSDNSYKDMRESHILTLIHWTILLTRLVISIVTTENDRGNSQREFPVETSGSWENDEKEHKY